MKALTNAIGQRLRPRSTRTALWQFAGSGLLVGAEVDLRPGRARPRRRPLLRPGRAQRVTWPGGVRSMTLLGADFRADVDASRARMRQVEALFRNHPGHDQKSHGRKRGGAGSGRDLTADQATVDRLFGQSTGADGHLREDERGDVGLAEIAHEQGFDGKPTTVSAAEFDRIVRDQGSEVLYRGIRGTEDLSAADIHDRFRDGPYEPGFGHFGNGYYMAPDASVAGDYADGTPGSLGRFALHPEARVIEYADLRARHNEEISRNWDTVAPSTEVLSSDPGRYAALLGYDAVRLSEGSVIPGRGTASLTQVVVVNRTALIASE